MVLWRADSLLSDHVYLSSVACVSALHHACWIGLEFQHLTQINEPIVMLSRWVPFSQNSQSVWIPISPDPQMVASDPTTKPDAAAALARLKLKEEVSINIKHSCQKKAKSDLSLNTDAANGTQFFNDVTCCAFLLQEANAKARKAFGGLFNRKPGLLTGETEKFTKEDMREVVEEKDTTQDDGASSRMQEASHRSSFIMQFGPSILLIFLGLAFLLLALDYVNSKTSDL